MQSRYRPPQPRQTATADRPCLPQCDVPHRSHAFNSAEQLRPEHPLPRRGAYV